MDAGFANIEMIVINAKQLENSGKNGLRKKKRGKIIEKYFIYFFNAI